ncbi:hypothetical protein SAMN03080614_11102 [Anaerobranca gottschalkii DSM 13577]|uniref:Uncharacterized protein n=1 Tax=Anaerobranca gottschalkii DSM 13577 TaxID=1120990 RepID=A0A1I0D0Y6_9FIRM|nr:hypothetical protein SAMN03080614_11102 [Anaerobranca gottschalkii DSM 13577]
MQFPHLIITELLFNHYLNLYVIPIVFGIILIFEFLRSHYTVFEFTYRKERNARKTYFVESLLFVLGVAVIYVTEVFLSLELGGEQVIIWFIASLLFIPVMNRKYLLRKSLKQLSQSHQKNGKKT